MHVRSKRWRGLLGTLLATGTIAGFAAVAAAPSAHAAFPGANGPIVYIDTSSNINLVNPSTGVVSQLCPSAACGTPSASERPEVSPNGATVAYINVCAAAGENLETIPIGGGLPNVVVANIGFTDDQVSWSPDGTKIALRDTNNCGTATPIGVVSATANNAAPTCLPNSATTDTDPSLSPDGTKTAVSNGGANLAFLNANGIGRPDF